MDSDRFEPANALFELTSVRLNFAGSDPVLVSVNEPLTVSPGFMFDRLKIAASFLELSWLNVPEVTEEMVLPVVEVNVAPEPTATAPAASSVASGTRTLRRLLVMGDSL